MGTISIVKSKYSNFNATAQWAAGGDFREKRKNKNAEKGKKEKLKRKD